MANLGEAALSGPSVGLLCAAGRRSVPRGMEEELQRPRRLRPRRQPILPSHVTPLPPTPLPRNPHKPLPPPPPHPRALPTRIVWRRIRRREGRGHPLTGVGLFWRRILLPSGSAHRRLHRGHRLLLDGDRSRVRLRRRPARPSNGPWTSSMPRLPAAAVGRASRRSLRRTASGTLTATRTSHRDQDEHYAAMHVGRSWRRRSSRWREVLRTHRAHYARWRRASSPISRFFPASPSPHTLWLSRPGQAPWSNGPRPEEAPT